MADYPDGMVLREYQLEMKARLMRAWTEHGCIMVQMPTGTGKTRLLAAVVVEVLSEGNGGEAWIVAHRRELVEQIEETVARYGLRKEGCRIRVMSVQWLSRHWLEMDTKPELIVVDEAHHATARSYREMWERFPEARKLGMTATPCRMDRTGFKGLFGKLLASWSIAEFIRKGYLALFDYVSIRPGSEEQRMIDSLEKRGADGDYQVKEMDRMLNRRPGIERLFQSMREYADGKKGIVYAVSISHARRIAECYSRHGVCAAAIDSRTPAKERKRMVEMFREGKIQVLVNVDVFSEGFDCPDVEFVQMARPTLSLAKYLQQVGRGLRKAEGKKGCVLIDNVGLYRTFGLPVAERDWEAMFEGRMAGKAAAAECRKGGNTERLTEREEAESGESLEVVMTCGELERRLEEGWSTEENGKGNGNGLKAFKDRRSGLWGLKRGKVVTAWPEFGHVFDVKEDKAAVRFTNRECGVVDEGGKVLFRTGKWTRMGLLKDGLLAMAGKDGVRRYADLKNGEVYKERPAVVRMGGIELLKAEGCYHSRTRTVYRSMPGADRYDFAWRGFYLRATDGRMPETCRRLYPGMEEEGRTYACLLEGDDRTFYWMCGTLADGSIVVMDGEERYWHVREGGETGYVADNRNGKEFEEVTGRLKEEAKVRARDMQTTKEADEENKRRSRMEDLAGACPFRSGTKWGLKTGERVIVPPVYRKLMPPVGMYCAFEGNACQWGIMAIDGKVVVEARYMKVELEKNGTAHLTVIPGKVKTVTLKG